MLPLNPFQSLISHLKDLLPPVSLAVPLMYQPRFEQPCRIDRKLKHLEPGKQLLPLGPPYFHPLSLVNGCNGELTLGTCCGPFGKVSLQPLGAFRVHTAKLAILDMALDCPRHHFRCCLEVQLANACLNSAAQCQIGKRLRICMIGLEQIERRMATTSFPRSAIIQKLLDGDTCRL